MTLVLTWMGLGSAKGNSASMGTTQGEMVVPKFLPRKGPRGTYSHAWMSLAENEQVAGYGPATVISNYKAITGSPKSLVSQDKK